MTRQEAIEWFKLMKEKFENTKYAEALNMAIEALEQEQIAEYSSDVISRQAVVNEIHKYFVEEIDKTPTEIDEDGDELYADMPTVNSLLACNKELSKRIKSLPSAEPNLLCALADRECPFQGKEYAWCLTCPHISEEDRALVKKVALEPKRGKWIADRYCSECEWDKKDADYTSGWTENYCPNCGADMQGDEE